MERPVHVFSRFLRYFLVVGRVGSIRQAADALGISASAIDRQILQGEAAFGMPLFERLPSGLRLTAAGELMMAWGDQWQKGFAELSVQLDDLAGLRRGSVTVAVIEALAKGFITRIVRDVQRDHPGIAIDFTVLDNDDVRRAVVERDVDFGILLEPGANMGYVVRAQVEVGLGIVAPPDHPLATLRSCQFSAVAGHRLVVPSEPLALCRQVNALVAAIGVPPTVAARADNIQMLKSLVLQNVGISVLTSIDVATEVASGELVFIRIDDRDLRPLMLGLCVVPARVLSRAAGLVLDSVEAAFGSLDLPLMQPRHVA